MNVPYTPDKYLAAIATIERYVTETAIAAAPTLGLLPSAVITAIHCERYLHFGMLSAFVGVGVESVSIAIVATRVLLSSKGLAHRERDMDRAFIGYVITLATVNLGLNVFNLPNLPTSWGQGLAELALGLLDVPVAWLVATRHEIATVQANKDMDEAKSTSLRAERDAIDEKVRAENKEHELNILKLRLQADAAEKDKKRAERLQKLSETPKNVPVVFPVVAPAFPKDIRKLTQDQKVMLSKMTAEEISRTASVTIKCGQNWLKAFAKEGL